jgi:hypothetical protein
MYFHIRIVNLLGRVSCTSHEKENGGLADEPWKNGLANANDVAMLLFRGWRFA